jgi:hypothetical protein
MAILLNAQAIEKSLVEAFSKWASIDVNQTHWREQFTDMSKWEYNGETKRKNGGPPVGSPRDIYDLGRLYESGVNSFSLNYNGGMVEASWHWDAKNSKDTEYANYVHEGTGTNKTARPFTDDVAVASSFFLKTPGMALKLRVSQALAAL